MSTIRRVREEVRKTVDLFAPGPDRRAARWDVYRAYMTHLPAILTRVSNAAMGVKPVRRQLALPSSRTLWYRPGTSDLRVLKQVFVGAEYEPDGALRGGVEYIIDLGSNIGLTAILWSTLFPEARIFCVEPDEENFDLLRRNLEQLGGRARAVRAAIAEHDGTIDFYRSSSIFFWSSSTDPAIAKGAVQKVTVPALTMGSVLAQAGFPRVDLLKMDIEGSERSLLPAAAGWPSIPTHLVAELHEPYRFPDFARDCSAAGLTPLEPSPRRKMAWAVKA